MDIDLSRIKAGDRIVFETDQDYQTVMSGLEDIGYRWLDGRRLSDVVYPDARWIQIELDRRITYGISMDLLSSTDGQVYKTPELIIFNNANFEPASKAELAHFLGMVI